MLKVNVLICCFYSFTMLQYEDCEKYMEQYASYDEKIVKGLIVQIFYHVESYNLVNNIDEELARTAGEYDGYATGEQGFRHGTRDLDFEFQTIENAKRFSERMVAS